VLGLNPFHERRHYHDASFNFALQNVTDEIEVHRFNLPQPQERVAHVDVQHDPSTSKQELGEHVDVQHDSHQEFIAHVDVPDELSSKSATHSSFEVTMPDTQVINDMVTSVNNEKALVFPQQSNPLLQKEVELFIQIRDMQEMKLILLSHPI